MIEHDERREAEIQLLCKNVLKDWEGYEHNNNDPDYITCNYCGSYINACQKYAKLIKHEPGCPVLIAKDLSREGIKIKREEEGEKKIIEQDNHLGGPVNRGE
jgi:hypothetical protein